MEFDTNIPIYVQVIHDIKTEIVSGILSLGDKLPSARELAYKYKINPNTAARIYKELEADQICYTKRGIGTFITEDKDILVEIKKEMASNLLDNFMSGMMQIGYSKEEIITLIQNQDK
ncbi:GntR family transcriptional regulator [Anaeromicropila herbilytica]|uniref:GntR family transcriptional regulator n=1 Tax=Anaeromicropila herbilytica TaxID=2785025 RepID=A0A7R7EKC6_9FIRM|nr:GntR family transcriptional regulator [Anaeromicropila herbilytica]BCN30358.1 GntR family transcriptional regulator [Anaeromicropila herbilytica]